jgi:hypothetical protein
MRLAKSSIIVITLFFAACSAGDSKEAKFIKSVEKSLVLPAKAEPLHRYDRTYALGPSQIKGILLFNGAEEGKFSIVPETQLHMERKDGGCGAIRVTYDRVQRRWTDVVCNGSA